MAYGGSINNLHHIFDSSGIPSEPNEYLSFDLDLTDNTVRVFKYLDSATFIADHPRLANELQNGAALTSATLGHLAIEPALGNQFCDQAQNYNSFDWIIPQAFPYIELVQTAAGGEGQACDIPICDTVIETPISVTTDSGATDGTATITATSSRLIEISLSSTSGFVDMTLQSGTTYTHTFTGLMEGSYTVYVRQKTNIGCIKNAPFAIILASTITYGTRWRLENFTNDNGQVCSFFLEEREYTGSITDVCGSTHDPIQIQWSQVDGDEFSPYRPAFATVKFDSTTNFQFLDLFTADQFKYRGRLVCDGQLEFIGFVVADEYGEPYTDPVYPSQFRLTDGLSILDTIEFKDIDGSFFQGKKSVLEAIKLGLDKLNYNLDIHTAVNTYETSQNKLITDDPLLQVKINPDSYIIDEVEGKAESFLTVIKSVLEPFVSFICQENGVWKITEFVEQKSTYNRRIYDSDLNQTSTGTVNPLKTITAKGVTPSISFTGRSSYLSMIPGFGKLKVSQDLNTVSNIIKGGKFEFREWTSSSNHINWDGAPYSRVLIDAENEKYGLSIPGNPGGTMNALYITQPKTDLFSENFGDDQICNIRIKYKINAQPGGTGDIKLYFQVILDDGVTKSYLKDFFIGTTEYIFDEFAGEQFATDTISEPNKFKELNTTVTGMSVQNNDFTVEVRIYQGISTGWTVTDVVLDTVEINLLDGTDAPPKEESIEFLNEGFNFSDDRSIRHADGKNITNRSVIFKNVFTLAGELPTIGWSRFGVDEERSLLDLYLTRIMSQRVIGKQQITGSLELGGGSSFGLTNTLNDPVATTIFGVNALTWNVMSSIYQVDLIEIDQGDIDEVITLEGMEYPDNELMLYPDGTAMQYE